MKRNTSRVRDSKVRRQAERLAPKAYEAGRKAARKIYGSGFTRKWGDFYNDKEKAAQHEGWITTVEYVLTKCLSQRKTNTNATKRKSK